MSEDKNKKETVELENEKDKKPVRLEFFESSTCPHCATTRPMIAEAKKIYGDDIEIVDVNLDSKEGQLAAKVHNIKATPTIKINNEVKFRGEPRSKDDLFDNIEEHLDEESKNKANKKKKQQKKRVNMMYS
jgi:thiol-disulfide isomerase/thioredoxin